MWKHRQIGFTQVELLIVLAIIAILALILFPVLSRARENARQSSCIANVRQIVSAISMYAQDHDEQLIGDPVRQSWSAQLSTYNEPAIYNCPTKSGSANTLHPDYGFNAALFGLAIGNIVEPDSAVLVVDLKPGVSEKNFAITDPDREIDPRHSHGVTVGFADGHVGHVTIVGQDIYEQFVALGLHFTADNSPLPWKVIAMGSGDTVNLSGRGSQGYFIFNGSGDFPALRPSYATSWDMAAFGKHSQNAATGWNFSGVDEGCSARLVCRDDRTFTGAAWTAQPAKDSYKVTVTLAKDDTATHIITFWTPWCHPNLEARDEQVSITGADNRQASFQLRDLRYTRGAYVTFSFTGPITITIADTPPDGESSTISLGALLFD
ncbi:MAG TPA: prepilin-type N-terminal cleavage/methylation domain-containing protein [Armatimonadota bacterium]